MAYWTTDGNKKIKPAEFLGTTDATDLVISTGGKERLRIKAGGDAAFSGPLTVQQTATLNGGLTVSNATTLKGEAGVLNLEGATHAYLQWYPKGAAGGRQAWTGFGDKDTAALTVCNEMPNGAVTLQTSGGTLTITANGSAYVSGGLTVSNATTLNGTLSVIGNVRLGTTTPAWGRLTIEHVSVPLAFREVDRPVDQGGLWRMPLDGGGLRFDVNTGPAGEEFGVNYLTPLIMTKEGNVGIGTTNLAGYRLNVDGSAYLGGDVTAAKSLTVGAHLALRCVSVASDEERIDGITIRWLTLNGKRAIGVDSKGHIVVNVED